MYGYNNFLADVGGILGLCVGASIMGFIYFMEETDNTLIINVIRFQRKK